MGLFKVQIYSNDGLKTQEVNKDQFIIGRSSKADLTIKAEGISREHLLVSKRGNEIWVVDKGTTNGSYIEEVKLKGLEPRKYKKSQRLRLGLSKEVITLELLEDKISDNFLKDKNDAVKNFEAESNLKNELLELESKKKLLVTQIQEHEKKISDLEDISEQEIQSKANEKYNSILGEKEKLKENLSEDIVNLQTQKEELEKFIKRTKREQNNIELEHQELIEKYNAVKEEMKDVSSLKNKVESEFEEVRVNLESERQKASKELDTYILENKLKQSTIKMEIEKKHTEQLSYDASVKKTEFRKDVLLREVQSYEEQIANTIDHKNELTGRIGAIEEKVDAKKKYFDNLVLQIGKNDEIYKQQENKLQLIEQEIDEKDEKIIELKNKIISVEENNKISFRKFRAELESSKAQKKLELLDIESTVGDLQQQKNNVELNVQEVKQSQTLILSEYKSYKIQFRKVKNIYDQKKNDLDKIEKRVSDDEKKISLIESRKVELLNEIEGLRDKKENAIKESDETKQVLLQEMQSEIENIEKNRIDYQSELDKIRVEIQSSKKDKNKLSNEIFSLKDEQVHVSNAISELQALHEQKTSRLKSERLSLEGLVSTFPKGAKDVMALFKQKESLNNEVFEFEKSINKLKVELNNFEQQKINKLDKARMVITAELDKSKEEAILIIDDAKKKASAILIKASTSQVGQLEGLEDEALLIIEKARKEAQEITQKADDDYKRKKQQLGVEINAQKAKKMNELREQDEIDNKDRLKRKRVEIESISQALSSVMQARVREINNQKNKESALKELQSEIKNIVKAVMSGENPDFSREVKKIVAFNPNTARKNNIFWMKVGSAFGSIIVLISINFIFPSFYPSIRNAIVKILVTEKNATEIFKDRINEERQNRPKFNPETTGEYKDSYTQNVLYTTDYIDVKLDEEYQNRWVIELNSFIVYELELSDDLIVQFITIETKLVQNLLELRTRINPEFEEDGIMKLEEAEREAEEQLIELFHSKTLYLKFKEFRKKFYHDFTLNSV